MILIFSYQFKATEFNPKIVEKGGMYGVKQMPDVQTTQVKPFHFESDSRQKQKDESQKPPGVVSCYVSLLYDIDPSLKN